MIISNDLKHDSFAVNAFVEKALTHLRNNKVMIKRLIMWSDNCGPQYKSCKVFDAVSKYEIPVMHNYFCAKHGKAKADGAIGCLSMHIDSVVRSGTHEFSTASEVYRYCQSKLAIHNDDPSKCCHWQRHYFDVSQINRDESRASSTVKGTLTLHSVHNVGVQGLIEVRESSCFCEVCFLNAQGECKNQRLVEDFAWASLYKNVNIAENVENKLWDTYSLPYTHAKKTIFRPMTASVSKRKGTKRLPKKNTSERTNDSNTSPSINLRNVTSVTNLQRDSDDSDYEDDLPLIHVKEGLKDISQGESPICCRTRKRLYQKNVVLCEKQGDMLYLEDYERVSGEVGEKSLSRPGYRKRCQKSKITAKGICSEQVLIKRNTIEGRKTSTPKKQGAVKECYINLSPIPKGFLSQLNHD